MRSMSLHRGPVVFAVEDTAVQLTWRELPPGEVTLRCGDAVRTSWSDGGPGAIDLTGLQPDTDHQVEVDADGRPTVTLRARTLPSPPGEELFRFATMSDLHLGRTRFGVRHRIVEPGVLPADAHPVRCARAAADELVAWGARRLVVKGDLVDANREDCWHLARRFVDGVPLPVDVLPGNHETAHGEPRPFELAAASGVHMVRGVRTVDVPGVRLVLLNSTVEGIDVGRWAHLRDETAAAVADAPGPAIVLVHHQPQLAPVPLHFPIGINSITASRFARAVRSGNPAVLGSSGHTHRHRRRTVGGVPWTEVGSPKDYPGAWAGYVVHEGGVRQVVRRVTDPDCLRWLDRTRRAAGGLWGLWSPGALHHRCFTHVWPR